MPSPSSSKSRPAWKSNKGRVRGLGWAFSLMNGFDGLFENPPMPEIGVLAPTVRVGMPPRKKTRHSCPSSMYGVVWNTPSPLKSYQTVEAAGNTGAAALVLKLTLGKNFRMYRSERSRLVITPFSFKMIRLGGKSP